MSYGKPLKLNAAPWRIRSRVPMLGEYRQKILGGYSGVTAAQMESFDNINLMKYSPAISGTFLTTNY